MSSGVGNETKTSRFEVGVGHVPSQAEVARIQDSSLAVVFRWLGELPVDQALATLNAGRAQYDAVEASLLAARLEAGASTRSVESMLQKNNKTSKRSAKKRARRAKAVNANPSIATKIKNGELSSDQADEIAAGADKTDGAAAKDDELVDRVAAAPPDQARKMVDEWVRDHTDNQKVQDAHDRQRRLRCVKRWSTDRGTDVLALEGDTASLDRIEQAIKNRSKAIYRADGGRDVAPGRHPRTRDQRNFDAAVELLTRDTDVSGRQSGLSRPGRAGSEGEAGSNGGRTTPKASSRPSPRSTIVITMTADQATGVDLSPVKSAGGGLLAPSVLEELFCGADLVGLVIDKSGMPLWMGRRTREFTHAQWLALIARDGGCARCGAHYSECHAHHIIPWNAPARGPTDVDNGVLVCTDCHHLIHDHDLILVRNAETGTWTTRPARPDEIAPKRPSDRARRRPEAKRSERGTRTERSNRSEPKKPRLHERHRTGALW